MAANGSSLWSRVNESRVNQTMQMNRPTALINMNFALGIWYICTVLILTILGTFGNIFIMQFTKKTKKFSVAARKFMTHMAVGDLIISGIIQPTCIVGALGGMETVKMIIGFCELVGALCITACVCVFVSLFNLTVNRYVNVCKNDYYNKIYTKTTTNILCALPWCIGMIAESPNFVWDGFIYDVKAQRCTWDRTGNKVYTKAVPIVLATLLVVMIVMNLLVVRKIYRVKKNLSGFNERERRTWRPVLSTSKILLTMLAVFLVCWAPSVIVLLIDVKDEYPMETYLLLALLAHSHSSTPALVYMAFKRDFRGRVLKLFCARCPQFRGSEQSAYISDSSVSQQKSKSNSKSNADSGFHDHSSSQRDSSHRDSSICQISSNTDETVYHDFKNEHVEVVRTSAVEGI